MVTRTWCAVVIVSLAATAEAGDWPMYGRTAAHSFAADHATLDQSSLGSLAPAWSFTPGDAVTATPAVVDGVVYVGSPAVRFYDPATGAILRELPQAGSVASAVVPVDDTIVFGTGNSYDGAGSSIQAWRVRH